MRAKPWDSHAFRLPNGLRVVHVSHPHLDGEDAVTMRVPIGTRHPPAGGGAFLALLLGGDTPAELGYSSLRWTLSAPLSDALTAVVEGVWRTQPDDAAVTATWSRVHAWAHLARTSPAVAAMLASHYAVFPHDTSYSAAWPGPTSGRPPPAPIVADLWRRVAPRMCHLVVASDRPAHEVEKIVREHPLAAWRSVRDAVRAPRREVRVRAPLVLVQRAPIASATGSHSVLAGVVAPVAGARGHDGELLPFLSRVPLPAGLHSSVWAHGPVSVWALWGSDPAEVAGGGSTILADAAAVYREVAVEGISLETARRVSYAIEADLRRICERAELLAAYVAGTLDPSDPAHPPSPPFRPSTFSRRLRVLGAGLARPRVMLVAPPGCGLDTDAGRRALRWVNLDRKGPLRHTPRG